jgi:hypothetical protein
MSARGKRAAFLMASVAVGAAFWWRQDWVVYVEYGDTRVWEAELPWWARLLVSSVVGCAGGAVAAVAAALAAKASRCRTKRCT